MNLLLRFLLFLFTGAMVSLQASRCAYIVREYPSWYNVTYKGDEECRYGQRPDEVMLWIKRPCGKVVESADSVTDESPVAEIAADAILGILNINESLYLNVVVLSEPVANVSFGPATAVDCKTSFIFSVKMIRMLPLDLQPQNPDGQNDHASAKVGCDEGETQGEHPTGTAQSNTTTNECSTPTVDYNIGIIDDLTRLLTTGHYFSRAADLTRSMQRQWELGFLPLQPRRLAKLTPVTYDTQSTTGADSNESNDQKSLFDIADPFFNWSRGMLHGIPSHWITVLIQGYVGHSLQVWNDKRLELLLIGRRSTYRYGTRLNARGIDEDGNVGNFVESELRIRVDNGSWKSYVQVRGSVPIFWSQKNIFSPSYFTKSLDKSEAAFLLHYGLLERLYGNGSDICFMSLLDTKATEVALTQGMDHINQTFPDMRLHVVRYNYNEKVKWSTVLPELLTFVNLQLLSTMQRIGYFDGELMNKPLDVAQQHRLADGRIAGTQRGVIRTNCLDCLDRTNAMQLMVGWVWLASILDPGGMSNMLDVSEENESSDSLQEFRDMWCEHGDMISFHHAGTASVYSQHIRDGKQSYSAMFHYTMTLVSRACSYVFNDEARQMCLDILIHGQIPQDRVVTLASNPLHNLLSFGETSDVPISDVTVWCGTWNMNGAVLSDQDDMYDWMSTGAEHNADIYVFFLQEFVELSAFNILINKSEETKEVLFNGKIIRMLTALYDDRNIKFFHLKSCSMVGLYMTVFVSERLRRLIRNVTTTTVKTGLGGNAGNKGAVGMKFEVSGYRFAFIDVHLNFGKIATRVRIQELDYVMRSAFNDDGLSSLYDDDLFVLAGDFNFQIVAGDDRKDMDVMDELYNGRLDRLLSVDEFLSDVKRGPAHLSNLQEAPILFEPTYKFKPGTNFYHMKRTPAWCDRVLYGGASVVKRTNAIRCLSYSRHDNMISSDHKAVSAVFHLSGGKSGKVDHLAPLIDI